VTSLLYFVYFFHLSSTNKNQLRMSVLLQPLPLTFTYSVILRLYWPQTFLCIVPLPYCAYTFLIPFTVCFRLFQWKGLSIVSVQSKLFKHTTEFKFTAIVTFCSNNS